MRYPRTGIGYDVHELAENRRLILGGVEIDFERGLLGHSDADVLVHAVMDAICGALKLGDIGKLFPDTDMQYKDISSLILLERVRERMDALRYEIGNVDAIVCAQRPKLAPHTEQMCANIARALGCSADRISVKATTTEKLGFVGREEGMSSYASVLLWPKEEVAN
ncbi:MAG: 2-C-methyl-D-erythritol 2,4-cyclodiphosphate synthase [Ndongobacter sp.]|nr:2-C-methyl-D-erythritol 2,4-cyclodiphosphate synthase [Ndongobacter sp.]